MRRVSALRGTGDEGCQWIDVHYEQDGMGRIRVTHIGCDISTDRRFRRELEAEFVGRRFSTAGELSRRLNGNNVIG